MAGAVAESGTVSRLLDDSTGGLIDLPALQRSMAAEGVAHACDRRVAGAGDDLKYVAVLGRHLAAHEACPRQIAVHGAGLIQLRPQVDEHEVVFTNDSVFGRVGLVMRIAAVRPY